MSLDLKIVHTGVQALVVARLREAIFAGVLRPGEKLSEAALCRSLEVSRGSVREALRSLAAERLVTIVPNRGPSVTSIGWEEAAQIYDVRALLEGAAMALFAPRAEAEALATMDAALKDFAAAAGRADPSELLTSTQRFYDVILDRCGNPVLAEMVQGLRARINFLRARSMSLSDRSASSLREMQAMLDALRKRDAVAARAAAIAHVEAARAAALKVFAEQPGGDTRLSA